MDKGKVTLYLDKDDLKELDRVAKGMDTSPSWIIRRLVRKYLDKVKSGKSKDKKHGYI